MAGDAIAAEEFGAGVVVDIVNDGDGESGRKNVYGATRRATFQARG